LSPDPKLPEFFLDSALRSRLAEPRFLGVFGYVENNPIKYIDPDGRDAIPMVFPDYKIRASGTRWQGLGHAGIIIIDPKTGSTRYYEYGRYDKAGKGIVRRLRIPDVKIDKKTGRPTEESLKRVIDSVSKQAGKGTRVEGTYVENDNFQGMADYAAGRQGDNTNDGREEYSVTGNNCGTFAQDVLEEGGEDTPWMVDPRPTSYVEELQDHYENKISYDKGKLEQVQED